MHPDDLKLAAEWIIKGDHVTAFTGAGISVESGIPAFRGADGVWSKYDPDILEIHNYHNKTAEVWPVIQQLFYQYFNSAEPNAAHHFLAFLEKKKYLKSLITQNIDNLHQKAGSKRVIEYHGNSNWLVCTSCGERMEVTRKMVEGDVPRCKKDNALLKPDFVFFGESIPAKASQEAVFEAERSDVMLLIGTTGEVMPASLIPRMARQSGAKIIEINTEKSLYTDEITHIFLKGKAAEVTEGLQTEICRQG